MPITNAPVVSNTRPDDLFDKSFRSHWYLYRQSHQLAKDYYLIRKHRHSDLLEWIKNNTADRPTLILDSFGPALIGCFDRPECCEYSYQDKVFMCIDRPRFISGLHELEPCFKQVLALGQIPFKYKTTDEYTELVIDHARLLDDDGTLLICLPMLHHLFHRLRYQPQDIIHQISAKIQTYGLHLDHAVKISFEYYLKISRSIHLS